MKIFQIYWLVDIRPETLAVHPHGYPFYCGMARGRSLKRRLSAHRTESYGRHGGTRIRKVGLWVAERDPHIRIEAKEDLASWMDMATMRGRLWYWTSTLHLFWPDNANIRDNGKPKPPPKRKRRKKAPTVAETRRADQLVIDAWNKQYRAERKASKPERDRVAREAKAVRDANQAARLEALRIEKAELPARMAAQQAMFRANSIRMKAEYQEAQRIRREAARVSKVPPLPY